MDASILSRMWVYQRERFPLVTHGLLVLVLAIAGTGYARLGRGAEGWPALATVSTAFLVGMGFFFQLRVFDEYKDYAEDLKYRPYRPVTRGLVSLRELAAVGVAVAIGQIVLALWLAPLLLGLLVLTWGYMILMGREFFVAQWLQAHPLLYMLSHMVITPLIILFLTACEWIPAGSGPPIGLPWFLAVGFFSGMTFELGRKIRAPEDEEAGVETYSVLWGRGRACIAWVGSQAVAAVCAGMAAVATGNFALAAVVVVALVIGAAAVALQFMRNLQPGAGKRIEAYSAVWTLGVYAILGIVPIFFG